MTTLRSPLARARGLGSAKEGVAHWWAERVSAAALVPLTLWLVVSLIALAGAPYPRVAAYFAAPLPAALTVLLLAAVFHHAQLGLQVVIEDYIHHEGAKIALILLMKGLALLLGTLAVLAVLRLALGD